MELGILQGIYRFRASERDFELRAQLLGSGAIMKEVLKAQEMLEQYNIAADVWSVTSYKELHKNALETERWNRLNPTETPRKAFVAEALAEAKGVLVAASDYMKILPDSLARHLPIPLTSLGTDGLGRSEGREELRDFFEVDAKHIVLATVKALTDNDMVDVAMVAKAIKDLAIDPGKVNPYSA